jgi:hypothetical protein
LYFFFSSLPGSTAQLRPWPPLEGSSTIKPIVLTPILYYEYRILVGINLKGRDYSEDLSIDVKIILEWIFTEMGWKVVDWISLALDRD